MVKGKFWYIKVRLNPQTGVHAYGMGQTTVVRAKKAGEAIYGHNIILKFTTESEYLSKMVELGAEDQSHLYAKG